MQFGVFLPTAPCVDRGLPIHGAVDEVARAAEALGFASILANDAVIRGWC
jgi:hypothetical protein